ncbi:hypothetical protein LINGRAHAP2_LOCUS31661 [Linum grandiflorum]
MYHEECTITLQDVEMLTCMPVFGEVVCAEYEKDRFNYTALLVVIGVFLLSDRSSAYVHRHYLLVLREMRPLAWCATVLLWLYREMERVAFKFESVPLAA